jgi:mannitol-specific phosphotransferase system IIBC component
MLGTLVTFAAEAVEDEPSKVPFYILGSAAAVWAIVLFAVGMRSPAFPGSVAAQRAVMAVSVLVVIGAMASAVITA